MNFSILQHYAILLLKFYASLLSFVTYNLLNKTTLAAQNGVIFFLIVAPLFLFNKLIDTLIFISLIFI